jgi:DNA-binding transcriptional regulator YiaG
VEFKEWITLKYLKWQQLSGRRRTMQAFAGYLGVQQPALSAWMDGRYKPKGSQNVIRLAEKLGPEV